MAFSTQKDFFHVPFMNQSLDFECKRVCVKLKSYDSTIDDRSWAMDDAQKSRFLSDLVTCNTPVAGYDQPAVGLATVRDSDRAGADRAGAGNRGNGPGGSHDYDRSPESTADSGRDRAGVGTRGADRGGTGNRGNDPCAKRGSDRNSGRAGAGHRRSDPGPRRGSDRSPDCAADCAAAGNRGVGRSGHRAGGGIRGYERAGGVCRGEILPSDDTSGADAEDNCEVLPCADVAASAKYCIKGGDSVLECANQTLGKLDEILNDKKSLQKQLAVSKECLKNSKEENEKIKDILNRKFDHNLNKDFHNKIQKLSAGGKISKSDENDLLQLYYKFEDMNKAYEVAEAESSYLKRLTEKLCQRATMDSITVEPEKETDVCYLQDQVNALRKEVLLLRKFEDENLRQRANQQATNVSDQDAVNIRQIIEERNALREKCKTFKGLEKQIKDLQKKAHEADNMSENLSANLNNHSKYICDIECEMQRMQKYYEIEVQKLKYSEDLAKCQIKELKEDLCRAQCKAQKSDCLQMEIGCLRNELLKRDLALGDYDCQYKQLMYKAKAFKNCGYRLLQQSPGTDHDNSMSS